MQPYSYHLRIYCLPHLTTFSWAWVMSSLALQLPLSSLFLPLALSLLFLAPEQVLLLVLPLLLLL